MSNATIEVYGEYLNKVSEFQNEWGIITYLEVVLTYLMEYKILYGIDYER